MVASLTLLDGWIQAHLRAQSISDSLQIIVWQADRYLPRKTFDDHLYVAEGKVAEQLMKESCNQKFFHGVE